MEAEATYPGLEPVTAVLLEEVGGAGKFTSPG